MTNKKEEAMEYLAKFATLIRGTLNASTEDLISLDQEVRILENYLALEKLRFNNGFEYRIECDTQLDVQEICIPPMLIQPFVENAIIHGLKNKGEDGLIHIDFYSLAADQLEVVIYDNGSKRKLETHKPKMHKSLGMKITSKRLAYNNSTQNENFTITPRYTEEGTYVRVLIKV